MYLYFVYISFVLEVYITIHSMNIVLGHTIKNTYHVIGIAIYDHFFKK